MLDIGYVILTWNSQQYIDKCMNSIIKMEQIKSKVIVIDNGSHDNTLNIIETYCGKKYENTQIKLIKLKKNEGTTKSRNLGIKELEKECRYICILDSDTVVNEMAMMLMMKVLEQDERNAIVGPVMENEEHVVQNSARKIPTLTVKLLKVLPIKPARMKGEALEKYPEIEEDTRMTGYLMSACWLVRRELFETIGHLDEKIFYAPEDVEFCIRTWVNGYRVLYCKKALITHSWQRLSRKKLISKHNYEHIKGLIYMFVKYRYAFSNKKFEKYYI